MDKTLEPKHIKYVILFMILAFGLYLRYYHVDYPVVGYHNWKETKYLTDARNFAKHGFFENGILVPRHDFVSNLDYPLNGVHAENFPATPMIVAIFFKIFGYSLWIARMVNILLSLLTIFFMYLFVKELFQREDFALFAALLAALNPLFAFWSHNTDIVNSAILFMVAAGYFYARWHNRRVDRDLILAVLLLMLSFMTKQPHLILGIPMALTFPYADYFKDFRKNMRLTVICAIIVLLSFGYMAYLASYSINVVKSPPAGVGSQFVDWDKINDPGFWAALNSYINDNYSRMGMNLAIIGGVALIIFFALKLKKFKLKKDCPVYALPLAIVSDIFNNAKFGYGFLFAYLLGFFPWFLVMSFKLSGHNYHQFPVAPLVILLISFLAVFIAGNVAGIVKAMSNELVGTGVKIAILAAVFLLLYQPSIEARNRMFDTQFPGLDVAGDYIRENSQPYERVIHSSQQNYGVLWHADRFGYKPPVDVAGLQNLESLDATWIFVYQWGFAAFTQKPELWQYIQEHYSLRQFGFYSNGQQVQPVYLLLSKGGSFNDTTINDLLRTTPVSQKNYELTSGQQIQFLYVSA